MEHKHSERGLIMLLHSIVIGVILYLIMAVVLKQEQPKAESRSVLIGAIVLVYMILFGHGLPKEINKNIR